MPIPELAAMSAVADALEPLEEDERDRVLFWARSRYSTEAILEPVEEAATTAEVAAAAIETPQYNEFSDLYEAANPNSQEEKALVAAYWLQVLQGQTGVQSQTINTLLKNMGHGISNITSALSGLMKEKPNSIMQTSKAGSSQQARKTYKVTLHGINRVKQMLSGKTE
jgi:hypothetical protein